MNILHVYKTSYPLSMGGVENVIDQIASQDSSNNHRVLVTCPNPQTALLNRFDSYKVFCCKSYFEIMSTPFFNPFNPIIRDLYNWADVLHYHYPWPFGDLLNLLYGKGKKYVVTYHADVIGKSFVGVLYSKNSKHFLSKADKVLATSPDYCKSSAVLKKLSNINIIPLGIDSNYDKQCAINPDDIFSKIKSPFYLFIGVHRYYKGLEYLVKACSLTDATIVIGGTGPETDRLKKMAVDLGLHNCIFTGFLSEQEKRFLLRNCLAFVLSSHLRSEAFGVCLLEAMAFSKPLITCDINSGMSFVNKHKVTGLVVKPSDPRALSDAMNVILNDNQLSDRYGLASRARFLDLFTSEIMLSSYKEVYRNIFNSKKY